MMSAIYYNQSEFSLGSFITQHDFLAQPAINGYPVLVIIWNLVLVLVPWLVLGWLTKYYFQTKFKKRQHQIIAGLTASLWLLFLPNAAYVMTDVRHVADLCPVDALHNVCLQNASLILFFFIYAILGWLSFVYLLRQANFLATKIWDKKTAKIINLALIPVIALGVLLGLLNRFNSWEIFTTPLSLFKTLFLYITNFDYFVNWLLFSLFLYILYGLGQQIFKDFKKINRPFK